MKQKTPGGSILDPPGVSSWVNALEKGLGPGVLPQPTKVRVLLQLTQQQGPQLPGLERLGLGAHAAVQHRVPQLPGLLQGLQHLFQPGESLLGVPVVHRHLPQGGVLVVRPQLQSLGEGLGGFRNRVGGGINCS